MRLAGLKTHGLGHNDVDIDLDSFGDALLIAICGPVGAGKSTVLEAWGPGAFYRKMPTRGSLTSLALTRDAMLEARVVNGSPWTIRHMLDAVSGKSESVVLDADGNSVLPSAKVSAFDEWAKAHLPTPELLYMTQFSAQGSTGFAGLTRAERMRVIGQVVANIPELEAKSEQARAAAREASVQASMLRARIDDEKARIEPGEFDTVGDRFGAELDVAKEDEVDAIELAANAAYALEMARAEAARVGELRATYQSELARWNERNARRAALEPQVADLEKRLRNNRELLDRGDEIRAAVDEHALFTAELKIAEQAEAALREGATKTEGELALAMQERAQHAEAERAELDRATFHKGALIQADAVRAAVEALPGYQSSVARATAELASARVALENIQSERAAGAAERIGELRIGLANVTKARCLEEAVDTAERGLEGDDSADASAKSLPERLQRAKADVERSVLALLEAQNRVDATQKLAARQGELTTAQAMLTEAKANAAHRATQRKAAEERVAALKADVESRYATVREAEADCKLRRTRIAELAPIVAKTDLLARAEERVAELEPQLAAARAALKDCASTPAPTAPPEAPDVEALSRASKAADKLVTDATSARVLAEKALDDARAAEERVRGLEAEVAIANVELSDWTRLAEDLGRDGLQALLIDAGGPELSAITNDLLSAAFGPRWTVTLDTTRISGDGKKLIEDCELTVIDTERGREGPLESFSGGERVILSEALSLALTTLACRNSGVERPTIVRDESGAALDAEMGRRWILMLRRAGELIGADKILFVAHSEQLQQLADARIDIGGVGVEG